MTVTKRLRNPHTPDQEYGHDSSSRLETLHYPPRSQKSLKSFSGVETKRRRPCGYIHANVCKFRTGVVLIWGCQGPTPYRCSKISIVVTNSELMIASPESPKEKIIFIGNFHDISGPNGLSRGGPRGPAAGAMPIGSMGTAPGPVAGVTLRPRETVIGSMHVKLRPPPGPYFLLKIDERKGSFSCYCVEPQGCVFRSTSQTRTCPVELEQHNLVSICGSRPLGR
jgi:hypothetical protein